MPINKYFSGGGEKVMENMKREYGPSKGERVFYATANARGMNPGGKKRAHNPARAVKLLAKE